MSEFLEMLAWECESPSCYHTGCYRAGLYRKVLQGVVVHTYNPRTPQVETGGSCVHGPPQLYKL